MTRAASSRRGGMNRRRRDHGGGRSRRCAIALLGEAATSPGVLLMLAHAEGAVGSYWKVDVQAPVTPCRDFFLSRGAAAAHARLPRLHLRQGLISSSLLVAPLLPSPAPDPTSFPGQPSAASRSSSAPPRGASDASLPSRISPPPRARRALAPPSPPVPMAVEGGPRLLAVALAAAWISAGAAASLSPEQAGRSQKPINCMPCSRTYIGDAYTYTFTDQLAHHGGLAEIPDTGELCKGLTDDVEVEVPTLSELHRQLVGEGSHRRLVYSMKFGACQDAMVNFLDGYDAHLVIIEKLPNGVFADPFELQHFVERKVFLDVAVFGDTNLELPSALSNQSAVEIHFDLRPSTLTNCNLVVDLPLHARYPPLDASGYATVEFGSPDLFLRYRKKEIHSDSYLWVLKNLETAPAEKATWRIPCGDEAHIGFVSSITFLSALVCSMSIVIATLIF